MNHHLRSPQPRRPLPQARRGGGSQQPSPWIELPANAAHFPSTHNQNRQTAQPSYRDSVYGQATWTNGGPITQCGIPWSHNAYMTAAVGTNSPYQCGQTLKVHHTSLFTPKDILVTVVDKVPGYPANKINLSRAAFQALGAKLSDGVADVQITTDPKIEEWEWGKYLLAAVQATFPNSTIFDYDYKGRTQASPDQIRQTYQFSLRSNGQQFNVLASALYNKNNNQLYKIEIRRI